MDLRRLLAGLAAAYPAERVKPETLAVYERMLADLPTDELETAVARHMRTQRRFPSIAELAGAVVERKLGLPEPDEAWRRASAYAFAAPEYVPCPACVGYPGLRPPFDETLPCRECGGTARREVRRSALLADLSPPEREALDDVGGWAGIAEAREPSVVRAQFLRLYDAKRARALERANLVSALDAAAGRPALEARPAREA